MQWLLAPAAAGCEVTAFQDDRFPATMVRRAIAALVRWPALARKSGSAMSRAVGRELI
jgi:hypothetical protein